MILVAGVPTVFSTSGNSPSLSVGCSIYDITTGTPVLISGPTLMANVVGNAYYSGQFIGDAGKRYLIFIAVYTDNTLATLLSGYEEQTEVYQCVDLSGGSSSGVTANDITGLIDCGDTVIPTPVFKIFKGDAQALNCRVLADAAYNPLDLSTCSEIVVSLYNSDGTITQRKLSLGQVTVVGSPLLGKFSTPLSSLVSAALNVGEFQNFDVQFTIGSDVFTVPYIGALSVYEVV